MKRTICLILVLLSITFVNAQKFEDSLRFEKLNLKPIESGTEKEVLRINRNEYFKSEAKGADTIALSYLQAKRNIYGLSSNLNDIKIAKIVETPSGKYVYCKQYVNEIPVFATNFTRPIAAYGNQCGKCKYTIV